MLEAVVSETENGALSYALYRDGRIVLEPSPLGIAFEETSFLTGFSLKREALLQNQEDSYSLLVGKRLENAAEWNELQLSFTNGDGHEMELFFRLYNDGLAFRYGFSSPVHETYTLAEEQTAFHLPIDGNKWLQPYDTIAPWSPAYERFYKNGLAVGTPSPWNRNGWALPMLFHHGMDWLLITEADLGTQYVGMHITDNPAGGLYTLRLPEEEEAEGRCGSYPTMTLPFETPWRVIITSDQIADIVESNLVFHLSKPQVFDDTDWIKPGRASWSWWSENDSPRDFQTLKHYIDFTADMGWEYFLVDANWNHMEGGSLEDLVRYANEKGVGIMNWYNSGGRHNVITEEPRYLMDDPVRRREEFRKISGWGIKGVKVDFFQSDKDCIIRQYHEILLDAADFRLLVNFHGSTLPRGWERTYPNLMTMEAVRGAEAYIFDSTYPENAPWQNTILPFTRNVVGSMDYTPVTFSDNHYPHLTTFGHELALAVLFESGIQHFADNYRSYLEQPDYVLDYLRHVPVVWDETRFVDGFPGKYVILARRNGDTWYMSGINGTTEEMDAVILPSFLPDGVHPMLLITDGDTDRSFAYQIINADNETEIVLSLPSRGGFAAKMMNEE